MRRLGLIGDIHAEDQFLAAALERLARENVDRVLAVGDIVDGRGDVDRCVELLVRHGVDVVRGNHDRWVVHDQMRDSPNATVLDALAPETRWYLAHLPSMRRFATAAGPLLLCHGFGDDDMVFVDEALAAAPDERALRRERGRLLRLIPADVSIVVCGHTHRRGARRLGRLNVINAGTLHYADAPCFTMVDLESRAVQFYDLDEGGRVLESERVRI